MAILPQSKENLTHVHFSTRVKNPEPNLFYTIPASVMESATPEPLAKLLMAFLGAYATSEGDCMVSDETLSKWLFCSNARIGELKKDLEPFLPKRIK